jgi:transcriptional regulator GlxA family with amidase domain
MPGRTLPLPGPPSRQSRSSRGFGSESPTEARPADACPERGMQAAFHSVAAVVMHGVSTFALGAIHEAFTDRTHLGLPPFDMALCAENPGSLSTDLNVSIHVTVGLEALEHADLIILLPAEGHTDKASSDLLHALVTAHRRGATIIAFCASTFLLAATGLLDGRRATTHARLTRQLAERYPAVRVIPDVLYVDEGSVITGAGAAACIDLCLHVLRREHGSSVANAIARELLAAPHRDGGQSQIVSESIPSSVGDGLYGVMEWALANLDKPMSVDHLADYARMSPRTFARRFKATTGTTPHSWLINQRLHRAEELLETADLNLTQVAQSSGFGSAAVLRTQFIRRRGIAPLAYRKASRRSRAGRLCP